MLDGEVSAAIVFILGALTGALLLLLGFYLGIRLAPGGDQR